MESVGAFVTTGLDGVGFDEGRYYALLTFATDEEPLTIALPPEFLGILAEGALHLMPQVSSLGGDQESHQVFNAREATVMLADDGSTVLRVAFGKSAEIRFRLPPGAAAQLGAGLLGTAKPE